MCVYICIYIHTSPPNSTKLVWNLYILSISTALVLGKYSHFNFHLFRATRIASKTLFWSFPGWLRIRIAHVAYIYIYIPYNPSICIYNILEHHVYTYNIHILYTLYKKYNPHTHIYICIYIIPHNPHIYIDIVIHTI